MPKRVPRLEDQLRDAIRQSGFTPNRICVMCDIEPGSMSRFLRAERGLSWKYLDRISDLLGLRIVSKPPEKTRTILRNIKAKKQLAAKKGGA